MLINSALLRIVQRLRRLMAEPSDMAMRAASLGLRLDAAEGLLSLRFGPAAKGGAWRLSLSFAAGCPSQALPRWLIDPLDGARVPVRSQRGQSGQLQSGWLRSKNSQHPVSEGSLGGLLLPREAPGHCYALTAGHVVASQASCQVGNAIAFYLDGQPQQGCYGRLSEWAPGFQSVGEATALDAAIAKIAHEQVRELLKQGWILPRGWAPVSLYAQHWLRTREQELPAEALGYRSSWMNLNNGGSTQDYQLVSGLEYRVPAGTLAGDSGAPIWDSQDRWVAMHVGHLHGEDEGEGNALAVPMGRVLSWCNAEVLTQALLSAPHVPFAAPITAPFTAPITPPVAAAAPASAAPAGLAVDVLARTIWGEAGGEADPDAAMRAVASVVLNRVKRQSYWGKTIVEVCRRPYQFSCWNAGSRRLPAMLKANAQTGNFGLACQIADQAVQAKLLDKTEGATHFYAPALVAKPPWAQGRASCASIGGHLFFNNIP